jgi:hypothetical protein
LAQKLSSVRKEYSLPDNIRQIKITLQGGFDMFGKSFGLGLLLSGAAVLLGYAAYRYFDEKLKSDEPIWS